MGGVGGRPCNDTTSNYVEANEMDARASPRRQKLVRFAGLGDTFKKVFPNPDVSSLFIVSCYYMYLSELFKTTA